MQEISESWNTMIKKLYDDMYNMFSNRSFTRIADQVELSVWKVVTNELNAYIYTAIKEDIADKESHVMEEVPLIGKVVDIRYRI